MANERIIVSGVDESAGSQADIFVRSNSQLITLGERLAGEDLANDLLLVGKAGPGRPKLYTPADAGINNKALGSLAVGNWLDVTGYSKITAYARVAGTYGGSAYDITMYGSPVQADTTWGADNDWGAVLSNVTGITAIGKYVVGNWGTGNSAGAMRGSGMCKVRVDIGAAGASANGWVFVLCEP